MRPCGDQLICIAGYIWAEDKEHCEEYGRMLNANPACVSTRAKKRGLPQLGTLGAGNHYTEIQVRYRCEIIHLYRTRCPILNLD